MVRASISSRTALFQAVYTCGHTVHAGFHSRPVMTGPRSVLEILSIQTQNIERRQQLGSNEARRRRGIAQQAVSCNGKKGGGVKGVCVGKGPGYRLDLSAAKERAAAREGEAPLSPTLALCYDLAITAMLPSLKGRALCEGPMSLRRVRCSQLTCQPMPLALQRWKLVRQRCSLRSAQ